MSHSLWTQQGYSNAGEQCAARQACRGKKIDMDKYYVYSSAWAMGAARNKNHNSLLACGSKKVAHHCSNVAENARNSKNIFKRYFVYMAGKILWSERIMICNLFYKQYPNVQSGSIH